MKASTPKEIRQARAFLQKMGIRTADMSPRLFADASKEVDKSFRETLRLVATLLTEGQGQGEAKQTKEFLAQND